MKKSMIIYVVERAGGWVTRVGGVAARESVESRRRSKDEAIAGAKLLASASRPSAVKVLGKDGGIEAEWGFDVKRPSERRRAQSG